MNDINQGPSDLQSDALPTELSRRFNYKNNNIMSVEEAEAILITSLEEAEPP